MAARIPDQVPLEFLSRHLTAIGVVVLSTPTVLPAAVAQVCVPWPFSSVSCGQDVSIDEANSRSRQAQMLTYRGVVDKVGAPECAPAELLVRDPHTGIEAIEERPQSALADVLCDASFAVRDATKTPQCSWRQIVSRLKVKCRRDGSLAVDVTVLVYRLHLYVIL